jgi:hypothetical protein
MVDAATPDRAVGLLHCRMGCGLASGLGNNGNLSREWSDFRGRSIDNRINDRDHSTCVADLWELSEVAMVFLGIPCSLRCDCGIPDSVWSPPIVARFVLRWSRGCAVGCISDRPGSIRAVGDEQDIDACVSAHDALTAAGSWRITHSRNWAVLGCHEDSQAAAFGLSAPKGNVCRNAKNSRGARS